MAEKVKIDSFVKVATPPCAAKAAIPCGLAVRKQHKMLLAASKSESKQILLMFVKNFFLEVAQKKGRTK